MLDRTQSLSRKVEHLPTKLSVQSHQLQLTVVFSISSQSTVGVYSKFSQKTNSPKQMEKTKSGLVD